MLFLFAVYDSKTGEITGRVKTSSPKIVEMYPYRIELTNKEYHADSSVEAVEVLYAIDIISKQLVKRFK